MLFRKLTLIIIVIFLVAFVKSVYKKDLSPSAYEIDLQARRLDYYHPKMWRVSHLLEKNQQVQLFYKYREKFFDLLDLEQYAKDLLK